MDEQKEVSFEKEVCLGIQEGPGRLHQDRRGERAAGIMLNSKWRDIK